MDFIDVKDFNKPDLLSLFYCEKVVCSYVVCYTGMRVDSISKLNSQDFILPDFQKNTWVCCLRLLVYFFIAVTIFPVDCSIFLPRAVVLVDN